jgi:hypothetical protein
MQANLPAAAKWSLPPPSTAIFKTASHYGPQGVGLARHEMLHLTKSCARQVVDERIGGHRG